MRREYPTQPIIGVGAVVMHDGKLLLVKRGVEPGKGKWSIPGGAVELGETVEDAAARETKEECGLDIELINNTPLDALDNIITDENGCVQYHYVLLQFLARPKGKILEPGGDVTETRWVSLREVKEYDLTSSFRLFLKKHED